MTIARTPFEPPAEIAEFLARLKQLDRGDLAILRRNAGENLATSRRATGVFYGLLALGSRVHDEIYFLVATLYGLNDRSFTGDFGQTMKMVKLASGKDSLDVRMKILLDCDLDVTDGRLHGGGELGYRLRQAVKLAASHEVGVDWAQLIHHLDHWRHPGRWVQKAWARSYFQQFPATATKESATAP